MNKGKRECRTAAAASPATLSLALLMATTAMVAPGYVRANPTGGVVNGGTATIGGEGTAAVTIDQTSDRAIIDWAGFDIAAGESTQFNQPMDGITLNRIGGGAASSILGSLSATGTIFLVNPNGVVFGAGSTVNVGSLVATTAGIANADFMAGDYNFNAASAVVGAKVENAGTITIDDTGLAALVAPTVVNSGTITASLGTVELAGAETFTVDLTGDGLLTFDTGIATSVTQSGGITANGGYVRLSAGALTDLVGGTINMSGTIQAQTASSQNGTVVLSGDTVTVGGDLDAGADGAIFFEAGTGGVTAGGDLTAGTLGIVSGGGAMLDGAGNAIGTLAADVTGGLTLSNDAALTVGSVANPAGGTLAGVSAASVDLTAAGNITVADAAPVTAQTGDITLTTNAAAGSLSLGENLSAASGDIFLTAGTGGVALANGATLSAVGLAITSGGSLDLSGTHVVGTLAVDAAGENLTFDASTALTIGTVGTVEGITAANVDVSSGGNLTVASAIDGANVTLTTGDSGALAVNADVDAGSSDVTLDAGTGGITTNTDAVITAQDLSVTSDGAASLGDGHAVAGLSGTVAGDLTFSVTDSLTLGGITAQDLTVDAGGNLTVASAVTADNVSLTTGDAGSLAVNADIDSGVDDVTLDAGTGGVTVDADATITAQDLDVTSDGAAALGEGHDIDGLSAVVADALTFGGTGNLSLEGIEASSITVGTDGNLTLNGNADTGSGDIDLQADGAISHTSGVLTAGNLSIDAGGDATLGAGHAVSGLSGTAGGDLTFGGNVDLSLDGITATNVDVSTTDKLTVAAAVTADGGDGDIDLAAGAGGITSGDGFLTAQNLDVTSGGAATLGDGHNVNGLSADVTGALTFGGTADLALEGISAASVTVGTTGALTLNDDIDAGAGDIALQADGAITHSAGVLTAANLSVGAGGDAALGGNHAVSGLSGTVDGDLSFGASGDLEVGVVSARNVDISAADGLSVAAAVTANGGDGDIALAAGAGGITSGNALLTAQDLSVTSGGAASLGTGHDIDGLSTGVTGVDGTLTFGSANALDLDGLSAGGMELTADSFSLNDGVTATAGDIVLRATDGGVDTNGNLFSAAGLGIESTGVVDLSGTHDVDVLAVDAGSGGVAFQSAGALEIGEVDGIAGVSADGVTLTVGGALDLAEDVDGADGDVSLTATGGGIGSSGGAITGDDLTIVAGGDVGLTDNANDLGSVTATLTGHDFAFLDADTINLGAIDAANIEVTATLGDLTVGSALSAGDIGLAAGDGIILDQSLTATGTIFMDAGAGGVALADGMTLAAAELGIRSGGALDLSGDHSVGTLAVDAAGQDLDFSSIGALEIGAVTGIGGSTIDGITVDSLTLDTGGALDLASDMTATDATLSVAGDITTSGGVAAVGALDIEAAEDVTLNGANDVDSLQATLTGALAFEDADGLILDGVTATGADITTGGDLTLASDLNVGTGAVTMEVGGDIGSSGGSVTAATLDIDAADDVTLEDSDVDALTADASGTVTFDDSDDVTIDITAGGVNVSAGGLLTVVSATSAGDLILTAGADGIDAESATLTAERLALRSGGAVNLTGSAVDVGTLAASIGNQALDLTNAGDLTIGTVDGVVGVTAGSVNLTASTGDITLASNLDVGTGTATLAASNGDIASTTGTVTAGLLDVTATAGNIDLEGDAVTLSATAGGSLAFADANALTVADATGEGVDISAGGLLTVAGAVAATDDGDLSLDGGELAIGADLDAAGNDILLTAGAGGIDVTSGVTMTADGLGVVSDGPIDLAGPHDISTIAASAAGQSLNFTSSGPLNVGTVGGIVGVTAGAATLVAGSGDLTVDSGIQAGAVSLRSGAAGGVIVNALVDAGGGTMVLDAGTGGVASNGFGLTAGRLAIISDGAVDLTDPNRVGVLAVRAPGRTLGFVNDGTIRVGTVAGVYGINAGPVDLTATSGDLIFDANHFMGGRNILRAPDGRAIFNGRIDGGHDLYVLALRDVFFNAAVGAQSPLRGVIVGSSYDFPAGVDLAVLTSDTILAAADAVGDTDGNIVVNDLFRATGAVVMTADLIHGSVTSQPNPNHAFDVGALFVSGRRATVYGKVAQFHDFGAAYEARRRELLDLPFQNPNYPIPEDFQMNECTIGTICPDPLSVVRLTPTQPIESFIGEPLLLSPVARMIGNDQELFSNSGNEEIW